MKCQRCAADLDETKVVEVPSPEWIVVKAIPCYECRTVTMLFPEIRPTASPFIEWARTHFGFQ